MLKFYSNENQTVLSEINEINKEIEKGNAHAQILNFNEYSWG
jgi:hypothetical protein